MTDISLEISGKIDPEHTEVIWKIKKLLDELDIRFFLVGASARDFVMEHLHDVKAPRKTMDIDFGVRIESWESYETIEKRLLAVEGFEESSQKQRFEYNDTFVDIVPFGNLSDGQNKISWPPEHQIVMSVAGFEDAYQCSTKIIISQDPFLEILVPTIPGMVVMKLLSWYDSYPERPKDAQDFYFFLINYRRTDIADELYEKKFDLLESEEYDDEMASIRILGQNIHKICSADTLVEFVRIIDKEIAKGLDSDLAIHIAGPRYKVEDIVVRLQKLKQGLDEPL